MGTNLNSTIKIGFYWDLLGSFVGQLLTFGITVVLARLLSPEEFGVVGMAMVFVYISSVFTDVGFVSGLIQQKEVGRDMLDSIFWLTTAVGVFVGMVIYFSASYIGAFYNNMLVSDIIKWLSLIPAISAIGMVHAAILTRRMDFKSLSLRNIIANLGGGLTGVVMAYKGFGVYALVGQRLTIVSLTSVVMLLRSNYLPIVNYKWSAIKPLVGFSSYVFFDQALRQVFQKVDSLFIGKFFSASTLGFYSRAESLTAQVRQYTTSSLFKVLYPAFSSLQDDFLKFEELYFKVFKIATFVSFLSVGILFIIAEPLIINLLGAKWLRSVGLFEILVFRLCFAPFGGLIGKSLLAKGYSKEKFRVSQIQRVVLLSPMIFGYFYGIDSFAIALVLAGFVSFAIDMLAVQFYLGISLRQQLISFVIPTLPLLLFVSLKVFDVVTWFWVWYLLGFIVFELLYSILIRDVGFIFIWKQIQKMFTRSFMNTK